MRGADSPPLRGRILGPAYRSGRLQAGATMTLEQTFLAGQTATIALATRGNRSIAIRVMDARDKSVCSEVTEKGRCRWLPLFTQRHRIELTNPGRQEVAYVLALE